MATHAAVAASAEVRRLVPALAELAGNIGDPMVRNMGTIGGSIANADPAACYPSAVLALGATIRTDRRTIAGEQFFTGLFETALEPGELIVGVTLPGGEDGGLRQVPPAGVALRAGRRVRRPHRCRRTRRGDRREGERLPRRRDRAGAGARFHARGGEGRRVVPTDDINGDMHGSAEYRAAMVSVMASRAVAAALAR